MKLGDRATFGIVRGVLVAPAPFFRERRWFFRALDVSKGKWVRAVVGESVLRDVETPSWSPGEEVRVGVRLRPGIVEEALHGGLRYRVRIKDGEEEVVGPDLLDLDYP